MIPGEAFLPDPPAADLPDDVAPPPPGAPGSPECPIPLGPATIIAEASSDEPAAAPAPEPEPPAPVDPWGVTDPKIFETPEVEEVWTPKRPAVAFFDQDIPTEQVPAVVTPPVREPEIVELPDISVPAVASEPQGAEEVQQVEVPPLVVAPPEEELPVAMEVSAPASFAAVDDDLPLGHLEPELRLESELHPAGPEVHLEQEAEQQVLQAEPEVHPQQEAEEQMHQAEPEAEPEVHLEQEAEPEVHLEQEAEPEVHELVRPLPSVPPPNTGAAVATMVAPARLGALDARGLDHVAVDVNPDPITRLEPDWGKAKRARSLLMLIVLTLIIASAVAAALAVGVELISVWANNAISKSAGS